MGISRDTWHKRRKTGGRQAPIRKKRKFELGRPAANTKISPRRIHTVRTRGGNKKYRALRLDTGNFAWGSEDTGPFKQDTVLYALLKTPDGFVPPENPVGEYIYLACTRRTRIIDTVYNASNNELVRTKTLVKNAIVQVDATPFRQWYEAHYAQPLGRKKGVKLSDADEAILNKKRSKKTQKKYDERRKTAKVEQALEDQFSAGRVLACISSRPGQCGRADGYVLEGKELEFYMRKIKAKKGK